MEPIKPGEGTPRTLETDYLIIGAGAMGMAFADVVFHGQPSAEIILVDRRARPGGHWNDAYPYVALHQPAAFYGLNSARLGTGGRDLASGPEIVGYYHRALQRMLASGRVRFMAQYEHHGDGRLESLLDAGGACQVTIRKRLVDAGHMTVKVPATHRPGYAVADGMTIVPPNRLAQLKTPWERYTVIGAGKTGMDAILFLLAQGVSARRICWIVPNEAWLWNRDFIQPGLALDMFLGQLQAVADHRGDPDRIFPALEAQGSILRIDQTVQPVKWRCATVDPAEVAALRTVENVIRLGRVHRITESELQLEQGSVPTDAATLHVDCTADGLAKLPPRPLFEPGRITLQSLFMCQQVLSAAIIGRMSQLKLDDDALNTLVQVIPHPEFKEDLVPALLTSVDNLLQLTPKMPFWLRGARLNFMHHESVWRYLAGAVKARSRLNQARRSMAS